MGNDDQGKSVSDIRLQRIQTVGHSFFTWGAIDVCVLGVAFTILELGASSFVPTSEVLREWIRIYLQPVLKIPGDLNDVVGLKASIHIGALCGLIGAILFSVVGMLFHYNFSALFQDKLMFNTKEAPGNTSESQSSSDEGDSEDADA